MTEANVSTTSTWHALDAPTVVARVATTRSAAYQRKRHVADLRNLAPMARP